MAISSGALFTDLVRSRQVGVHPFAGALFDQLAAGIAAGVAAWTPSVSLSGIAVGSSGVGTISPAGTRITLLPNPGLVAQGLASAGVIGPLGASLATVVSQALATTFSVHGQYAGAVAGCGLGSDTSRVSFASGPLLVQFLLPALGSGPLAAQLAQGLGVGIAALVATATGIGSVTGGSSPTPGSGPSTSVLV